MKRSRRMAMAVGTALVPLTLAGAALADDAELRALAKENFEIIPMQAPQLGDANVMSRERVELGKMLFFDPRMSRSGLFS